MNEMVVQVYMFCPGVKLAVLGSVFKSSLVWFFGPKMGNQQPQPQFWLLILGTTATELV